jgi:hypothetical protein
VALVILPAFDERLVDTAKRFYDFYGPLDFVRLLGRYVRARIADRVNRVRPLTRPCSARDVARRCGIIMQCPVPIHPADSLHDLMVRSKQIGARALLQAVDQIQKGMARPQPMDRSQATYFSFPQRADARRLRRMGHALL